MIGFILHSLALSAAVYIIARLIGIFVKHPPKKTIFLASISIAFGVTFLYVAVRWFLWLLPGNNVAYIIITAITKAFFPAFYVAVFTAIPSAAAMGAYEKITIKNKELRAFISVWIGVVIMMVWMVVFPWTLAGFLSLLS